MTQSENPASATLQAYALSCGVDGEAASLFMTGMRIGMLFAHLAPVEMGQYSDCLEAEQHARRPKPEADFDEVAVDHFLSLYASVRFGGGSMMRGKPLQKEAPHDAA